MRASLADQSIAIALGANLGDPASTLIAVRPLLEQVVDGWLNAKPPASGWANLTPNHTRYRWSPLFRTEPVGGPDDQPSYLNAVLVISTAGLGDPAGDPSDQAPANATAPAMALLHRLQGLEAQFGRQRHEHWGPRSLDLDLLWCGDLCCQSSELELPHPRLLERSFVLAPLAAVDPNLIPPGQTSRSPTSCSALLEQLLPQLQQAPPKRVPPQQGWPE